MVLWSSQILTTVDPPKLLHIYIIKLSSCVCLARARNFDKEQKEINEKRAFWWEIKAS
jgi:hypothetical protein